MTSQLHWEDLVEGSEIQSLAKVATTQMLVQWAGASGDFNPLHYEDTFASLQGVGKPIVHGQLKRAWLIQFLVDWIGEEGAIRKFSCQFRAVDYPRMMKTMVDPEEGETWWCKGMVTRKYADDGEGRVDCDIWVENSKGEKTTVGSATIVLPRRQGKTS